MSSRRRSRPAGPRRFGRGGRSRRTRPSSSSALAGIHLVCGNDGPRMRTFSSCESGTADRPSLTEVTVSNRGNDELRAEIENLIEPYRTVTTVPVTFATPRARDGRRQRAARPCSRARALACPAGGHAAQPARAHSLRRRVARAVARMGLAQVAAAHARSSARRSRRTSQPISRRPGRCSASCSSCSRSGAQRRHGLPRRRRGNCLQSCSSSTKPLSPERSQIGPVLTEGAAHGIYVVWLGTDVRALPGECRAVIELDPEVASLKLTDPRSGETVEDVIEDELSVKLAREAALALAPVVDTSAAEGRSRLPREVSLLELLGIGDATAAAVAERWRSHDGSRSGPLGAGVEGPFVVDLARRPARARRRHDRRGQERAAADARGVARASTHPPDAADLPARRLQGRRGVQGVRRPAPHRRLRHRPRRAPDAARARISLNAELAPRDDPPRRGREGPARDGAHATRPRAPPSLVIVIDEFATLANEVPEFVEGVVDVAQRGRSLGLHLVLATQRPRGVGHRQHPREHEPADRAAHGRRRREPGRDRRARRRAHPARRCRAARFALTGHGELTEFQAAYVGGRSRGRGAGRRCVVARASLRRPRREPSDDGRHCRRARRPTFTQLVKAAAEAPRPSWAFRRSRRRGCRRCRSVVSLAAPRRAARRSGAAAGSGCVDEPALQRQRPLALDLERDGSLLVYGASGSGKTTLLRTLARLARRAARARRAAPLRPRLRDPRARAARGAAALRRRSSPARTRSAWRALFALLRRTIAERKELLRGAAARSTLVRATAERDPDCATAADRRPARRLRGLRRHLRARQRGELVDALPRLVADGRPLGVHFAITADRRGAVPGALAGVVPTQVVLRMADDGRVRRARLDAEGRARRARCPRAVASCRAA